MILIYLETVTVFPKSFFKVPVFILQPSPHQIASLYMNGASEFRPSLRQSSQTDWLFSRCLLLSNNADDRGPGARKGVVCRKVLSRKFHGRRPKAIYYSPVSLSQPSRCRAIIPP